MVKKTKILHFLMIFYYFFAFFLIFLIIFYIFFVFCVKIKNEEIMRKILSLMRKAIEEHSLLEEGDKVAVGLSGGKDSLSLLVALKEYQKYIFPKFELVAISVDLTNGQNDFSDLKDFCEKLEVPLTIVPSNVFEIVFDIRKEKNPCSLCANLRRGLLNSKAKELGCNKVALGHHRDDLVETFLLSLFFEGRLSTFKAKTYLSKTDITVIRPLLYVEEKDLRNLSKDFPVLHNPCPADKHTERERAKKLLSMLEQTFPSCKEKLFNAIIHKDRYNLF